MPSCLFHFRIILGLRYWSSFTAFLNETSLHFNPTANNNQCNYSKLYSGRQKKVVTMNQWVMLVVPNTAVVWPSQKKGKGLCQLSKGLPHSAGHWGGPPLLLHSGRRDFFRSQGDRGPGGVGLHCAWPGQPGWGSACSGGPSAQMSAHAERTLESDGKKKKKKKTRVFTVKGPQSDHWGIYWTPTVDFALLNNDFFFFCTKMYCCQKLEGFEGECTRPKQKIYKILMWLWSQMVF